MSASDPTRWQGGRAAEQFSSAARDPDLHLFRAGARHFVMSVADGAIREIGGSFARGIDSALDFGDGERVRQLLAGAGVRLRPPPLQEPPRSVPTRALSLAVAQSCNLGCTYCYAQQGSFGAESRGMPLEVSIASVDRLLAGASRGDKISITFLGGEPLANRSVLQAATRHARRETERRGMAASFSITTNATLVEAADVEFFSEYQFAVAVSVDGLQSTHDVLRPLKSGRGSFDMTMRGARMLLGAPSRDHGVTARVTVTPKNLRLRELLTELLKQGFDAVQFSPLLASPTGSEVMDPPDLDLMLEEFIGCAHEFERRAALGFAYPFTNMISALRQIHHYRRSSYPCGAGGGYLGVAAEGELFACHRFVNDPRASLGSVAAGVDENRQRDWLAARDVHAQEPCGSCWARYLCSGGCHYEAINSGRPACDYIRGWLQHCLGAYARLLRSGSPLLDEILGEPDDLRD